MDILRTVVTADEQLFITLNQIPHPVWLNNFFLFFSFYPLLVWALIGIVVIYFEEHYDRWFFAKMLIALLASGFIASAVIKPLVKRPRPDLAYGSQVNLIAEKPAVVPWNNDYAFPSGHAAVAFAGVYVLTRKRSSKKGIPHSWNYVFLFVACLTAYSRIYLGKHYPLDTLFGAGVGWFAGWVTWNMRSILILTRK